ncbi:hypothetical protein ACSS6W_003236 [Trichoderma asperelloides]|uniref:Pre-mRNA splicing factor n=2 Tax=Trichoderma asperellum TaxID=101201 RepID=A0A6V8QJN8_TRIAP|nr:hypothetical protein M441DRAFT_53732 [Trichoderma asperellum CBS 433.97]KAH8131333.1 hypothetical protein LI328DRAFT_138798 [Trichoderma asperelloides]PTB47050.1 hypothetical protein M441DRAFT_53732 [Trichoderma asperellum CBS 433.97]UKZ87736.1 hypothetical protein TrAFT101_003511 [Trichoderma asperellum]GFP52677.1 hypothetical protein TASIC1_0001082900 [Trichoderma asperellum]
MTRVYVYTAGLVAFVAATAMIVASITEPHWVSYSVTTTSGETLEKHIGLHKSCSSLDDPHCRDFPSKELCQYGERYFCSMWRTVGFMASFTIILCLASLIAFALVMGGGKYRRETGWPFVSALLTLVSVVEFIIISIVAYLYDHDDQFTVPGWNLDVSWYLGTVSAGISLVIAAGLAASAYLLPPEEGYEFLDDPLNA